MGEAITRLLSQSELLIMGFTNPENKIFLQTYLFIHTFKQDTIIKASVRLREVKNTSMSSGHLGRKSTVANHSLPPSALSFFVF